MWILASASPRRREILHEMGIAFEVHPARSEQAIDPTLPLPEAVTAVARAKAEEVAAQYPGRTVLAADTVVAVDGEVLGKPRDAAEAGQMLRRLAGRTHTVVTGVWVCGALSQGFAEQADVTFWPMTEEEIDAYVATGEPMDKAGAYGIQGKGMRYVRRINGDFYTVMGLPASRVWQLFQALPES